MTTITTKYAIGDRVFEATTTLTSEAHPCPDCSGTRKWKAISPAGNEYEFRCPRCSQSYRSDDSLNLTYPRHTAAVHALTIGSVQTNTADSARPVQYMCHETGVGSGRVYDERDLFPSKEDADAAADALAKARNLTTPYITKAYDKTIELSDYQLENAMLKAARDTRIHHQVKLQMFFEDLRAAEDMEQVKELIEAFSFKDED